MSDRIEVKQVDDGEIYQDLYASSGKIYNRSIKGRYQRLRRYTGWPLMLAFLLTPWFNWDGRQSVLFDLPARMFHVFGITFFPQDGILLAIALIIAAFTLFTVTNLIGRVWCGFTCPQTVWTMMFMWVEHKTEGDRSARIRLDKSPMSAKKFTKKFAKHAGWVAISLVTAITFVGYFVPIKELVVDFVSIDLHRWALFWILFFTMMTYMNAGYLREQVCKYMCPYARFQSVMYDVDTLVVSYDEKRGEPRGAGKRKEGNTLGDCVDCTWCVQVCPVDIDIREGLQFECINCGLCVDACNDIMEKTNQPKGLIRFTTEHELEGGKTHILRPRFVGYLVAVLIMVIGFGSVIVNRVPLKLDALRDRNVLYRENFAGNIENVYTLKVVNMEQVPRELKLSVTSDIPVKLMDSGKFQRIPIEAGEVLSLPVRLEVDPYEVDDRNSDVVFKVETVDDARQMSAERESRMIVPVENFK